jgi:aspartate ammonia-lyase
MQPGSSLMPGKINPVIPEMVNQVAFHVIGMDVAISFAAEAGQLQLNAFEPLMAFGLLQSATIMRNATAVLRARCVEGI